MKFSLPFFLYHASSHAVRCCCVGFLALIHLNFSGLKNSFKLIAKPWHFLPSYPALTLSMIKEIMTKIPNAYLNLCGWPPYRILTLTSKMYAFVWYIYKAVYKNKTHKNTSLPEQLEIFKYFVVYFPFYWLFHMNLTLSWTQLLAVCIKQRSLNQKK